MDAPRRARLPHRGVRRGALAALGLLGVIAAVAACAEKRGPTAPAAVPVEPGQRIVGLASWYGQRHHGLSTASGERYDMHRLTAAHRTLPFGTRLRVTSVENGRSVVVRVNDRGPHVAGRLLDLSYAAAKALDMVGDGVTRVEVLVLPPAN
jgi:rare lipoprotein A